MEWFRPLWTELKKLVVPFGLAAAIALYGFTASAPPFSLAGAWALVVTLAMAVFRSFARKESE